MYRSRNEDRISKFKPSTNFFPFIDSCNFPWSNAICYIIFFQTIHGKTLLKIYFPHFERLLSYLCVKKRLFASNCGAEAFFSFLVSTVLFWASESQIVFSSWKCCLQNITAANEKSRDMHITKYLQIMTSY